MGKEKLRDLAANIVIIYCGETRHAAGNCFCLQVQGKCLVITPPNQLALQVSPLFQFPPNSSTSESGASKVSPPLVDTGFPMWLPAVR